MYLKTAEAVTAGYNKIILPKLMGGITIERLTVGCRATEENAGFAVQINSLGAPYLQHMLYAEGRQAELKHPLYLPPDAAPFNIRIRKVVVAGSFDIRMIYRKGDHV